MSERFHIYTIKEMSEVEKRQETEPWPAAEALAVSEYDYRRGYCDGWRIAVDELDALLTRAGLGEDPRVQEALGRLWDHHEGKLDEWKGAMRDKAHVHGHPLFASGMHHDTPYESGGDWPPALAD